jgi:hypothetical protein
VLPSGEFEFGGHAAHAPAPVAPEYLPAAQFVHDDAPAAEYFPVPQSPHCATERQVCPQLTPQFAVMPDFSMELSPHTVTIKLLVEVKVGKPSLNPSRFSWQPNGFVGAVQSKPIVTKS